MCRRGQPRIPSFRQSAIIGDTLRLRRFAIPIAAILAIVAVAAATGAVVVAARSQQPQTIAPPSDAKAQQPPAPELPPPAQAGTPDRPTPAPKIRAEAPDKPAPEFEIVAEGHSGTRPAAKGGGPRPPPKPTFDRGPKGNRVPPGPPIPRGEAESSQAVSRAGDAAADERMRDAGQGTVYTWQDGGRTMRVVLQEDLAAQDRSANAPQDASVAGGGRNSIVRKRGNHGGQFGPVFRSESGGGLMTLPGGVMLALDPKWDQAGVDKFLRREQYPGGAGVTTGVSGQRVLCGNRAGLPFSGPGQHSGRTEGRGGLQSQLVARG